MSRAERKFLRAIRLATEQESRQPESPSSTEARHAAITEFARSSSAAERKRQADVIESQLDTLARDCWRTAMRALCDLVVAGFPFSGPTPQARVVESWAASDSAPDRHVACWNAATATFGSVAKAVGYIATTLGATGMSAASTGFRQGTEECLAQYVRNGSEADADAALTFLAALRRARSRPPATESGAPRTGEPGSINKDAGGLSSSPMAQRRGLPATMPDAPAAAPENWGERLLRLGDEAVERGDVREARRRYQAAVKDGVAGADQRLLLPLALDVHDAIKAGDRRTASIRLRTLRHESRESNCAAFDHFAAIAELLTTTRSPAALAAEIARTAPDGWAASFWVSVAALRGSGDLGPTANDRELVDIRGSAGQPSSEWRLPAQLLAALLAGDEVAAVETSRELLAAMNRPWPTWCPVECDSLVLIVARRDGELLTRLIEDLDEVDVMSVACQRQAGRALSMRAAELAAHGQVAGALRCLASVKRLDLSEPSRAVASTINQRIGSIPKDELACAHLDSSPRGRSWSPEALSTWESIDHPGPEVRHHIAIALHSRAFDLERTGSWEALRVWKRALGHWSALAREESFVSLMQTRLPSGRSGGPVAPERIRSYLTQRVLGIHGSFVQKYLTLDPRRARAHLDLIGSSQFPQSDVQEVLLALAGTQESLDVAVELGEFPQVIERLEALMALDAAEAEFTRLVVAGYRLECARRGRMQLPGLSGERIDRVCRAASSGAVAEDDRVRRELARLEYWAGRTYACSACDDEVLAAPYTWWKPDRDKITDPLNSGLTASERAAERFERALTLDPRVRNDPEYLDIYARLEAVQDRSNRTALKRIFFLAEQISGVKTVGDYMDISRTYESLSLRPTVKKSEQMQEYLQQIKSMILLLRDRLPDHD